MSQRKMSLKLAPFKLNDVWDTTGSSACNNNSFTRWNMNQRFFIFLGISRYKISHIVLLGKVVRQILSIVRNRRLISNPEVNNKK